MRRREKREKGGQIQRRSRESQIRGERKGERAKKGEEVGRRKVGGERSKDQLGEGRKEGRERRVYVRGEGIGRRELGEGMSTRAHREGAQTGAPAYASVNVIDWPASAETCKGTMQIGLAGSSFAHIRPGAANIWLVKP